MIQQNNSHALSTTEDAKPRYTGERMLRERPKAYRQVVRLLGEGWSSNKICKWLHVTRETVRAVGMPRVRGDKRTKKSIVGILANLNDLIVWARIATSAASHG